MTAKALILLACIAIASAQLVRVKMPYGSACAGSVASAMTSNSVSALEYLPVGGCSAMADYANGYFSQSLISTNVTHMQFYAYGTNDCSGAATIVSQPLLPCALNGYGTYGYGASGYGYFVEYPYTLGASTISMETSAYYGSFTTSNYTSNGCKASDLAVKIVWQIAFSSTLCGNFGIQYSQTEDPFYSQATVSGLETGCSSSCTTCLNTVNPNTCSRQTLTGSADFSISAPTYYATTSGTTTVVGATTVASNSATTVTSNSATTVTSPQSGSSFTGSMASGSGGSSSGNGGSSSSSGNGGPAAIVPSAGQPTNARYNATGGVGDESSHLPALIIACLAVFVGVVLA